jgi:N-acetylmuramoyl-L-alanine amidase
MKKKRFLESIMAFILLASVYFLSQRGALAVASLGVRSTEKIVIIDASHGGIDPGKVGANGELEKEINLSISIKLKALLEEQGIKVIMTRTSDSALYDENAKNKKSQDLQRRVEIIERTAPDIAVSIHQNSYGQESVYGPQVFYFSNSATGRQLAISIQESMNSYLEIEKPREVKGNDSYYLLKNTSSPTVIVECGFLSNREETQKLITEEYQNQIAEALLKGIMEYLDDI